MAASKDEVPGFQVSMTGKLEFPGLFGGSHAICTDYNVWCGSALVDLKGERNGCGAPTFLFCFQNQPIVCGPLEERHSETLFGLRTPFLQRSGQKSLSEAT